MRRKAWFPQPSQYHRGGFRREIPAGITVGVLLVPQAMAYALLAEVDPIYGLYASLIPLLVYGLLSSSPQVSVGPTALASLVTLGVLSGIPGITAADYPILAVTLAGITGLFQLIFGAFRLGVLVTLLSRPVISGFVSAAAILIMLSQIKTLFGLDMPRTTYLFESFKAISEHYSSFHWPTAIMSLGSLLLLLLSKRYLKGWGTLLLIIVATAVTAIFQLDQYGLSIVGELPRGLPTLGWPEMDLDTVKLLIPGGLILAMLSFVETVSIAKTYEEQHAYYRAQPNRELIALGLSKIIGSFFQSIPTSGSFSRSAVAHRQGATTFRTHLITVAIVILALFLITDLFHFLPLPALSVIIVLSVEKLFDLAEIRRLWHMDRKDWLSLVATLLVTLIGGLQLGIATGVLISLGFVLLRNARPHLAELGRLPGTTEFRNRLRFEALEIDPAVLIVRFDAELYFGNADYFRSQVEQLIEGRGSSLKAVIIDAQTINDLDSTGAYTLEQLYQQLQQQQVALYLCGTIGPVRDHLHRFGLMNKLGLDRQFLTVQQALDHFQAAPGEKGGLDQSALQHNYDSPED